MRLSISTAILCALVAVPIASAQRPVQRQQLYQRNVLRAADVHPNMPVAVRSQSGEALRIVEFRTLDTSTGRLADRYKGLRMNRDNMRQQNRRTLSTATPRAISQRYPEGQFVRRGGQSFRLLPGRSINSF